MNQTIHQSMKIKHLRKLNYFSMREWMLEENNIYVGRKGRIWITENEIGEDGKKNKTMYYYPQTKWGNPYKYVSESSLKTSLEMYREYLYTSGLINQVGELKGKNLGCFCEPNAPCHAKILAELANSV